MVRFGIIVVLVMALVASFSIVVAQETDSSDMPDLTIGQALKLLTEVPNMLKTVGIIPVLAFICTILVQVFKSKHFGGVVNKIPKNIRFLVPTVLSFLIGYIGIGMTKGWLVGLLFAITVGPTSIYFHEILSWAFKKYGWT